MRALQLFFNTLEIILVVLILSLIAYGALHLFMKSAARARHTMESDARDAARQLNTALRAFEMDHGILPTQETTQDTHTTSTSSLTRILLANEPTSPARMNVKGITYLSSSPAKPGRSGLDGENGYIDPWGSPYHIILDTNDDNTLTNPETNQPIQREILVYSPGPDQDPTTWSDNIKTW